MVMILRLGALSFYSYTV